jgi:hypothetical protein
MASCFGLAGVVCLVIVFEWGARLGTAVGLRLHPWPWVGQGFGLVHQLEKFVTSQKGRSREARFSCCSAPAQEGLNPRELTSLRRNRPNRPRFAHRLLEVARRARLNPGRAASNWQEWAPSRENTAPDACPTKIFCLTRDLLRHRVHLKD